MNGFLVRVGIDSTSGGWNAPMDEKTGKSVLVPIPDGPYNPSNQYIKGGKRTYVEVKSALNEFAKEYSTDGNLALNPSRFELPKKLENVAMHLDPDFCDLTYGDSKARGKCLLNLEAHTFLAFYASLRSIGSGRLVYALIGLFEISRPSIAGKSAIERMSREERLKNSHSCWFSPREDDRDVIVYADEKGSGLFDRCIEIGCQKDNRHYYVQPELLQAWGGFGKSRGWLTRSPNLLRFSEPEKFRDWLNRQQLEPRIAQYRAA